MTSEMHRDIDFLNVIPTCPVELDIDKSIKVLSTLKRTLCCSAILICKVYNIQRLILSVLPPRTNSCPGSHFPSFPSLDLRP